MQTVEKTMGCGGTLKMQRPEEYYRGEGNGGRENYFQNSGDVPIEDGNNGGIT